MVTAENLTNAQIVRFFKIHCECRPADPSRTSHSHDCATYYTDYCRVALDATSLNHTLARVQVATWLNELIADLSGNISGSTSGSTP